MSGNGIFGQAVPGSPKWSCASRLTPMASDPYGRDGYEDRADDIYPRTRPLDQAGEERGQQQSSFGGTTYPGHDYWATTGRPDAPDQRAYDGGWTRAEEPDAYGRPRSTRDGAGRAGQPQQVPQRPQVPQWPQRPQGAPMPPGPQRPQGAPVPPVPPGPQAYDRGADRGDWNRGSRAWEDPYGAGRDTRPDRGEPPLVR